MYTKYKGGRYFYQATKRRAYLPQYHIYPQNQESEQQYAQDYEQDDQQEDADDIDEYKEEDNDLDLFHKISDGTQIQFDRDPTQAIRVPDINSEMDSEMDNPLPNYFTSKCRSIKFSS